MSAYVLLHNPIRFPAVCAAISGIIGVALLVLNPTVKLDSIGVFAGLGSAVSMAFGSVLRKKWQPPVPLLTFAAWQLIAGGVLLLPTEPAARYETLQWVFFQMGAVGPIFGQLGFFHKFAGTEIEDKRPLQRYAGESKRLLKVLDGRLAERQWMMGENYTIADISLLGWVRCLLEFYQVGDLVDYTELKHVPDWLSQGLARPASQRGLLIPE